MMKTELFPRSTFLAVSKPLSDEECHGWFRRHTARSAEKPGMRCVHDQPLSKGSSIADSGEITWREEVPQFRTYRGCSWPGSNEGAAARGHVRRGVTSLPSIKHASILRPRPRG